MTCFVWKWHFGARWVTVGHWKFGPIKTAMTTACGEKRMDYLLTLRATQTFIRSQKAGKLFINLCISPGSCFRPFRSNRSFRVFHFCAFCSNSWNFFRFKLAFSYTIVQKQCRKFPWKNNYNYLWAFQYKIFLDQNKINLPSFKFLMFYILHL